MIFNTFIKKSTSAGVPYAAIPSGGRLDILAGATFNNASTTIFTGTTSVGTSNTSGIVLTASATNGLQVVAEDNGVVIASGNVKAIKGRMFLKANAGDCTVDGILGQVKINTNITCSADYTNGIRGYLELVGGNTVNTGGSNANIGAGGHAVHGWITAAADLTIAANHYLCGVASRLSVTAAKTITTTGVLAAYGVFADDNLGGATATQKWQYGFYIPTGTAVAGLVIGQKSSSAAVGHAIGVANSADTAGDKAVAVFCDDANAVLATDAQGINSRSLILHAQTGVYGMSSLRGHLRVVASITPSASKGFYGTESYVEASGTYTIGDGTNFTILSAAGASVELGGTPTIAANAVVCGLHISGKTLPGSPTGEAVGILFQALAQGYEHTFGFTGVGTTDGNGLTTGSDSTNVTHKIAVWINGVGTRYIHVFSD
jgi:hypothetical protein